MALSSTPRTRRAVFALAIVAAGAVLASCTNNPPWWVRRTTTTRPTTPTTGPSAGEVSRDADPVVVTGAQVGSLIGAQPGRLVAFRASGGKWVQVPVQVDEKKATTMAAVYNLPASQVFYASSINVPVTVYADTSTFVGADTANPNIDADDEIVFMARDRAAPRATWRLRQARPVRPWRSRSTTRWRRRPRATCTCSTATARSTRPRARPTSTTTSRSTAASKGDLQADGRNPENSTVTGKTYTAHFSDRWLLDGLTLTQGDRPTVDVIDRIKWDIPLFCIRNENTFDAEEGAFIVNKTGPVRALRSYVGANSGPNTQNTHAFYDTSVDTTVDLRVHGIPMVGSHIDFNRQAYGMTFRDPS